MTGIRKLLYAVAAGTALLAFGPTAAQTHEEHVAQGAAPPAAAQPSCPMGMSMGSAGEGHMQHMTQMQQMMQKMEKMHSDMQAMRDQMKEMRQHQMQQRR